MAKNADDGAPPAGRAATAPERAPRVDRCVIGITNVDKPGLAGFSYAQHIQGWERMPEADREARLAIHRKFMADFMPGLPTEVKAHPNGVLVKVPEASYEEIGLLAMWTAVTDARTLAQVNFMEDQSVGLACRVIQRMLTVQDQVVVLQEQAAAERRAREAALRGGAEGGATAGRGAV